MRESAGKRTARALFYRECLPRWLSTGELQNGNILILLGDRPRELPYLDRLGVPRHRIWSVERDYQIYARQMAMAPELGISLYYGELVEYLHMLLHREEPFTVLNLDIEGSYLTQLDPAMTSVLLFCWHRPQTVVATYSSVGRDRTTLREGIVSLATLFAFGLDPSFIERLERRYAALGTSRRETPINLVLRDVFWMRSILEHALVAAAIVGEIPLKAARHFLAGGKRLWAAVKERMPPTLRARYLRSLYDEVTADPTVLDEFYREDCPRVTLGITRLWNVIYQARGGWHQRCYFTSFARREEPKAIAPWVAEVAAQFLEGPLTYINRRGTPRNLRQGRTAWRCAMARNLAIARAAEFAGWQPRQIPIEETLQTSLYHARETIAALRGSLRRPSPTTTSTQGKEAQLMASVRKHKVRNANGAPAKEPPFVAAGVLTDFGKAVVRKLASLGCTTAQIMAQVPRGVPEGSVRAYVAVAHRKPKRARRRA